MGETTVISQTSTPLVYHIHLVGKELICNDKIIIGKYDNKSVKLRFYLNDMDGNYFVAYKFADDTCYTIDPLDTNNEFTVTSVMSTRPGIWNFLLVSSSSPLDEDGEYDFDNVDFDSVIFTSLPQKLEVKDNFLDNEQYEPEPNENLEILFGEIVSARKMVQEQTRILQEKIDYADYLIEQLTYHTATATNTANNALYEIEQAKISQRYSTFDSLRQRQDYEESIWVLSDAEDGSGNKVVSVDLDKIMSWEDRPVPQTLLPSYSGCNFNGTDDGWTLQDGNSILLFSFNASQIDVTEKIKCILHLQRTSGYYYADEERTQASIADVAVYLCVLNRYSWTQADLIGGTLIKSNDLIGTFQAKAATNKFDISYALRNFYNNNSALMNRVSIMLKLSDAENNLDRPVFGAGSENCPRLVFTT